MTLPPPLDHLTRSLDVPGVCALVLMGSHARGDAGPHSDVDLVCFVDGTETGQIAGTAFHGEYLVVVSTVTPERVAAWFTEPEDAVNAIIGVRTAQALIDRSGYFAAIRSRALAFVWDDAMQERANRWASEQMVSWIEEAHKGLEGLRRDDIGRLLNARYGLSLGLSRVMKVQRGVLLAGDNAFYSAMVKEMAPWPDWVAFHRTAFAIEGDDGRAPTLRAQVIAGLRLYVVTAELLRPVLRAEDAPLIAQMSELIQTVLPRFT